MRGHKCARIDFFDYIFHLSNFQAGDYRVKNGLIERARGLLLAGNHEPLINYDSLGKDARLSAPTPDPYLPMLYVLGVRRNDGEVSFLVEGFDGGSVSMLSFVVAE